MLYRLYAFFSKLLRANRLVHRIIFGFSPLYGKKILYWDWTTLSLRMEMPRHVRASAKFLDMGTGSTGVLAIFARQSLGCEQVYAIDKFDHVVAEALKNAQHQGAAIHFIKSDLLSEVHESFDCIVFNAPYIDRDRGMRRGILPDDEAIARFCGGDDGCAIIELFLKAASSHLNNEGRILLGVNRHYVSAKRMEKVIRQSGYLTDKVSSNWFTGGSVYVLTHKVNEIL